jgi:hypothetical protein
MTYGRVTLQINLSGGDTDYAGMTVPWLVEAHRSSVDEVLLVVDLVRPQQTRIVDPEVRFPRPLFHERAGKIEAVARDLVKRGWANRVYELRENDPLAKRCLRKYAGAIVRETHDFAGCALASYLVGIEEAKGRFVVHYDADMLLHQEAGEDWCRSALEAFPADSSVLSVCPRTCPPLDMGEQEELRYRNDHGVYTEKVPLGWRSIWFSARCWMLDRERLERFLPLVRGKYALEVLARKALDRTYPPPFEIMLYRTAGREGGRRLELASKRFWLTHPARKDSEWLDVLPKLKELVDAGRFPEEQRGKDNLEIEEWRRMCRMEATNGNEPLQ